MIRPESKTDEKAIRAMLKSLFPSDEEAKLVDALRSNGNLMVSLVAIKEEQVVGHVAFSPVVLGDSSLTGAGLAPIAVAPGYQGRGYGRKLIAAGLDACRKAGVEFVVVLGSPAYYQQFGFQPASRWQLENEYGAGKEFMALELVPGSLKDVSGLVRYGQAFSVFAAEDQSRKMLRED